MAFDVRTPQWAGPAGATPRDRERRLARLQSYIVWRGWSHPTAWSGLWAEADRAGIAVDVIGSLPNRTTRASLQREHKRAVIDRTLPLKWNVPGDLSPEAAARTLPIKPDATGRDIERGGR